MSGIRGDRRRVDAALDDAGRLGRQLNPAARKQAAVAVVLLRARGVDGLARALALPSPSEGTARAWDELRRVVTPAEVHSLAERHGVAGLAFVLGWVKRWPTDGPAPAGGGRHRPNRGGR